MICPNKNHPDWIKSVKLFGENRTFKNWLLENYDITAIELPSVNGLLELLKLEGAVKSHKSDEFTNSLIITKDGYAKALNHINKIRSNLGIPGQGIVEIKSSQRKKGKDGRTIFYVKVNENFLESERRLREKNKPVSSNGKISMFNLEPSQEIYDKQEVNEPQVNPKTQARLEKEKELITRLKRLMSNWGITVEQFDKFMEEYGVDANGIADFANMLIRVNDPKHLPEEVSHFIIRMLKDSGLRKSLMDLARQSDLYAKKYDLYFNQYKNEERVAEEVAGQLLGQAFTDTISENNNEPSFIRKLKKLADFIWSYIKKMIGSKPSVSENIKKTYAELAGTVLSGEALLSKYNLGSDQMFSLADKFKETKTSKEILEKSIKILINKIETLEKSNLKGEQYTGAKKKIRDKIQEDLNNKEYVLGIQNFITGIRNEIVVLSRKKREELVAQYDNGEISANEFAGRLRTMHTYVSAYSPAITSINEVMQTTNPEHDKIKEELTEEDYKRFKENINAISTALNVVENFYETSSNHVLEQVFKEKTSNKDEDIAGALEFIKGDIGNVHSVMQALYESPDPISRIIDKIVKEFKEKARLETIEDQKTLLDLQKNLESKGIKNTEFAVEIGKDGKRSNYFVSEFRRGDYEKAKRKHLESIKELSEKDKKIAWFEFYKEHGTSSAPNKRKYSNPQWDKLSDLQKEYVNFVVSMKEKKEKTMPNQFQNKYLIPQIYKDMIERVKAANSGEKMTQLKKIYGDRFIRRSDDTGFGDNSLNIDEKGRGIDFLPIFFRHKIEDPHRDMSTDITSVMTSFSAMANDYNEMSKTIHILEVAKDAIGRRKVLKRASKGVHKYLDTVKSMVGIEDDENVEGKMEIVSGEQSELYNRITDYYNMVIYGKQKKDEGTLLGKYDQAKTIDFFNRYVAINSLAFNLYAGINNVALGNFNTRMEGITGEYFGNNNLMRADRQMAANFTGILKDIGQRKPSNKILLWTEYANTLQDFEEKTRNIDADRKTVFGRLFNMGSLFFMSSAGEFQIQTRSSLALADTVKLKDSKGNIVSLFDAFKEENGRLVLKDKYTIENNGSVYYKSQIGEEFKMDEHWNQFVNKQNFINQELHGIYNNTDRNTLQQWALGRSAMMFRKFLAPAFNRRFRPKKFNEMAGAYREGYYVTTWNFLKNIFKDGQKAKYQLMGLLNKENVSEEDLAEIYNLRRGIIELGTFIALTIFTALLYSYIDMDDEDEWAISMLAYQLERFKTELGMWLPIAGVGEALTILKSPAAGINQVEAMLNVGENLFKFWEWGDSYQSGPYKDWNKQLRGVFDLMPAHKTIYSWFHPEEKVKFFLRH